MSLRMNLFAGLAAAALASFSFVPSASAWGCGGCGSSCYTPCAPVFVAPPLPRITCGGCGLSFGGCCSGSYGYPGFYGRGLYGRHWGHHFLHRTAFGHPWRRW